MSNEYVVIANESNFETEVLNFNGYVIIDFFATWCGPCNLSAPAFDTLAIEYKDKVKFVKCNVDDLTDIAAKYHINSIPILILFKNGEIINKRSGSFNTSNLKEFIEENIK